MRFFLHMIVLTTCLSLSGQLQAQKTALLLIDIQDFYFPGGSLQLENPEQAGMNAGLLLEEFRKKKSPIYHVKHNFEPGGDIHQYVKPKKGERIFSKDQVNAFLETGLLEVLQTDSIESLVICGMQTHMCVEAAVRAAHDYGFDCILIEDACATRSLQYKEHIIPAINVHYSSIQTLQSYSEVMSTTGFLSNFIFE